MLSNNNNNNDTPIKKIEIPIILKDIFKPSNSLPLVSFKSTPTPSILKTIQKDEELFLILDFLDMLKFNTIVKAFQTSFDSLRIKNLKFRGHSPHSNYKVIKNTLLEDGTLELEKKEEKNIKPSTQLYSFRYQCAGENNCNLITLKKNYFYFN